MRPDSQKGQDSSQIPMGIISEPMSFPQYRLWKGAAYAVQQILSILGLSSFFLQFTWGIWPGAQGCLKFSNQVLLLLKLSKEHGLWLDASMVLCFRVYDFLAKSLAEKFLPFQHWTCKRRNFPNTSARVVICMAWVPGFRRAGADSEGPGGQEAGVTLGSFLMTAHRCHALMTSRNNAFRLQAPVARAALPSKPALVLLRKSLHLKAGRALRNLILHMTENKSRQIFVKSHN